MQYAICRRRFADASLTLGTTVDDAGSVGLPGPDLIHHTAILGSVSARQWEDVLVREQARASGGLVLFDLWATKRRVNLFGEFLREQGRAQDLFMLDCGDVVRSGRWNPTLAGSADDVVEKLMALTPPVTVRADRDALCSVLQTLVRTLRASGARYTLGDIAVLLRSGAARQELARGLPESEAKQEFARWLALLGNERAAKATLQRIAGRYAARLEMLVEHTGARVYNDALPTVDLDGILRDGKFLYVGVDRHDPASKMLAKMLVVEVHQALERVRFAAKTPFLVFMGDLGRVISVPATMVDRATTAGVGLVLTMVGCEATTEGADFVPTLLREAATKIVCDRNNLAVDAVTDILGCDENTSILLRDNSMLLVRRPELPAGPADLQPIKRVPLALREGETTLGFQTRYEDQSGETGEPGRGGRSMELRALH